MKWFNVIHNDGGITVRIDDNGFATLVVDSIEDDEVLVQAINRAAKEGAVRGTLFTGDVYREQMARMHRSRAATGTTWLGGKVTWLGDGEIGPQFRIDWDEFPSITVKEV